jgi:hypothetical protein
MNNLRLALRRFLAAEAAAAIAENGSVGTRVRSAASSQALDIKSAEPHVGGSAYSPPKLADLIAFEATLPLYRNVEAAKVRSATSPRFINVVSDGDKDLFF